MGPVSTVIDALDLAITLDYTGENFILLCKLVIDGRPNCFITEGHVACLSAEGELWMLTGTDIPQGTLFEFVD